MEENTLSGKMFFEPSYSLDLEIKQGGEDILDTLSLSSGRSSLRTSFPMTSREKLHLLQSRERGIGTVQKPLGIGQKIENEQL
jgi:hypothetical protein